MSYTRNMACTLANLGVQQFKTLERRNQLAVRDRATPLEEDSGRTWRRMNKTDVAVLAAQAALLADYPENISGLAPDTTKMIVSNTAWFIAEVVADTGPVDAWLGYVTKISEGGHSGGHVSGTLADVTAQIASDGPTASRVYLLNLSRVIREVAGRAAEMGVAF